MDVLRCDILQIDLINLTADLHVPRHLRRSNYIVQRQRRVFLQLRGLAGCSCEFMSRCVQPSLRIDFPDFLYYFKQSRSSRDPAGLKRRGNSKTDSLLCPTFIRHYQIRSHRIKSPFHTFHGSIE